MRKIKEIAKAALMIYLYYFIVQIVVYALFELVWFLFDKENGNTLKERIKLFVKKMLDTTKKVEYRIKDMFLRANELLKEEYI